MRIHKDFSIKEKRHAEPGELIYIDAHGMNSPAIVLQNDPVGGKFFLILQSEHPIKHPFCLHDPRADGFITTYGCEWILDISDAANARFEEFGSTTDYGLILFSEAQAYMRTGGVDQSSVLNTKSVNLNTFGFGAPA